MEIENNINSFIESYLKYHQQKNSFIIENLQYFLRLAVLVDNCSYQEEKEQIDWDKVSKSTIFKNAELIDNFYHSLGIDFKINNIIADGTLDIQFFSNEENNNPNLKGLNKYDYGHKSIEVVNNGLITDSVIWVHEISHYRNQPPKQRNQINDLLTEALAYTEEFLFLEYLNKLGYTYEAYKMKQNILITFHCIAYDAYYPIKMFLLYRDIGDTSKESFKFYYGEEKDYENIKKGFTNLIKNDEDALINGIWYTLAGALSVYMYEMYKENHNFLSSIEKLNNSISNKDFLTCLRIIGLDGFTENTKKKIEDSYKLFIDELNENKKKIHIK